MNLTLQSYSPGHNEFMLGLHCWYQKLFDFTGALTTVVFITAIVAIKLACHTLGPCLNIKTVFPGIGISIIKMRRSSDRLIFIMGISILVKQHLHVVSRTNLQQSSSSLPSLQSSRLSHTRSSGIHSPSRH